MLNAQQVKFIITTCRGDEKPDREAFVTVWWRMETSHTGNN